MEKICLKLFSLQKIYKNKSFIKKQPPEWFCKKGVLKKSHKIHLKAPVLESLFNRVSGSRLATLLKGRLQHRCFQVNFVKFLRTPFLQNTSVICLSLISQRSFMYLFKPSFVRKMDKTHNFAIFSFCQYILYILSIVNVFYRSKQTHEIIFRQWDKWTIFIKCRTSDKCKIKILKKTSIKKEKK